jgi:uracil-DNA glycosylase family 4
VSGEGTPGAILIVGEGPSKEEEAEGRPFVGRSGGVLREALRLLNMTRAVYITNVVPCRSCAQGFDGEGRPIINKFGKSVIRDQPPTPEQVSTCLPRLQEEIYLVDPVIIVALGGTSAETLYGKPVGITAECGKSQIIEIPGAAYLPKLTEVRQQWGRKVKGQWVTPTEQNNVRYLYIPCLHPAYVLRTDTDKRQGSALDQFMDALTKARDAYCTYMREVFGMEALEQTDIKREDMEGVIQDG